MAISDIASSGLSVFQSPQDKFATQMKVDGLNERLQQGKVKNAETEKMQFMQILITQLKNQNPLDPLNDKDFIAQMAQLTSVEKLEKMNERLGSISDIATNSNLFGLIGKTVSYIDSQGQGAVGVVDSIDLKGGKGFISVAGQLVNLADVHKIQQTPKYMSAVADSNESNSSIKTND